ncbi:MAG: preprotein translocase subunit SecG [Deltaproteobacteria bacterium]|nr:preprotein translocase subunit SecG [Deltaproteobacteria bacterium]
MSSFITLVHVVVAIILMISVLLQTGKGSGLGAAFGGSSSSVFGARGPATLIGRVTTVAAIIFMVTSLTLSVFAEGASRRGSVIQADPEPAAAAAPVEGRAVSEEEAQSPVDPTSLPVPVPAAPATAAPDAAPAAGDAVKTDEPEATPATGDVAKPAEPEAGPAVGGATETTAPEAAPAASDAAEPTESAAPGEGTSSEAAEPEAPAPEGGVAEGADK